MKDYLDLITAESIKEINEDKKGFDEFKDKFAYTMAEIEAVLNKTDEMISLKEENRILKKALELACKELRDDSCMRCNSCNRLEMCDYVLSLYPTSYFIEEAKEVIILDAVSMPSTELKSEQMDKVWKKYKKTLKKRMKKLKKGE